MKYILLLCFCTTALCGPNVKQIAKCRNARYANSFVKLGDHIIAEFINCKTNLNNFAQLKAVLVQAATVTGATVLKIKTHQFEPYGMTGVAVLQESHISVHTWPEYNYVAIDVFTCGAHIAIDKALDVLKQFFSPDEIVTIKIDRGF